MTVKLKTCRDCENMVLDSQIEGFAFAYCKKTASVLPQLAEKNKITFHRIPEDCPRNDVIKSPVGIEFNEIKEIK